MSATTTRATSVPARSGLDRVLADITAEREAQHAVWGMQHHLPDGTGSQWRNRADAARRACERAAASGRLSWRHILLEEVAEALAEDDPALLRGELVQVGAVVAQWLQAIDHRGTHAGRRDPSVTVTTELLLARHGEAACNVAGIVGGDRGCTGLTPLGRQQIERLAARLAAEHAERRFDVIYATPRRRVRETAEIVTQVLDLPVVIESDLRGPDHGQADGQPWHEIKTAFGGPPQHDPDQPYAAGAKSWNTYLDRATHTLQTILDRHTGQRVLVLAHGETIQAAHTLLLGLAPGTCRHAGFVTDHACLTRWQRHVNRLDQVVWMLAAHNDTHHLTGDHS